MRRLALGDRIINGMDDGGWTGRRIGRWWSQRWPWLPRSTELVQVAST